MTVHYSNVGIKKISVLSGHVCPDSTLLAADSTGCFREDLVLRLA